MDEVAFRRRLGLALLEEPDLVADAGAAELADPEPGVDGFGKGQRPLEAAEALHAQADDRPVMDVEPAGPDQVLVDDGVEVGIVDDVVDVAVDVVVHPTRRNGEEMPVEGAARGSAHDAGAAARKSANASNVRSGCSSIIMWPAPSRISRRAPLINWARAFPSFNGVMRSSVPDSTKVGQPTD